MTPAAKAVLLSMTVECREALTGVECATGYMACVEDCDGQVVVDWSEAQRLQEWGYSAPLWRVPADPTAIVAEAARMAGAHRAVIVIAVVGHEEHPWAEAEIEGDGLLMVRTSTDPLAASLEVFKAAHGMVSA